MVKEDADTEITFLLSVVLWLFVGLGCWMFFSFYSAWQTGNVIEFTTRRTGLLNLFPMGFQVLVIGLALAFLIYLALAKTIRFIKLASRT